LAKLIDLGGFIVVEPRRAIVERVARVVEPKDAPVVAGAIAAGVSHLVTYDRKRLLSAADPIREAFSMDVCTPDAVVSSEIG
jgi:hypothetical protein